jgi:archaellum biogenesis ATPase FlaH
MVEDLLSEENQLMYIEAIASNPTIFTKVNPILKAEYFAAVHQPVVNFLMSYYAEYRKLPHNSFIKLSTGQQLTPFEYSKEDSQFLVDTIEEFCKFTAVKQHVLNSAKLIQEGKLDLLVQNLTKAVSIKVDADVGIEYFEGVAERLTHTEESSVTIPTLWKDVDSLCDGIGRKQLILFLAPSGGGKSVGMINLAFNLLKQGLNGIYVSLEMDDLLVANRLDSIITRMKKQNLFADKQLVEDKVLSFKSEGSGKFFIKRMRENTTTANDVHAYAQRISESRGIKIDFIVVDYLDIMCPNSRQNSDNLFIKEKQIAEEVRAIGFDLDCIMISAAQLGRASHEIIADNKSLGQQHIQGGISKINTSDLAIALVKREEAGEYQIEFLKSRNSSAVGKKTVLAWHSDCLLMTDIDAKVQIFTQSVLEKKLTTYAKIPGASSSTSIDSLFN